MTDKLASLFDANWYLETYPDVAKAGADPWQHYQEFGRYEGRQPCALPAFSLEARLWFENDQSVLAELQHMASVDDVHGRLAGWVVARWHASYGRFEPALVYMPSVIDDPLALDLIGHRGPFLLLFTAYLHAEESLEGQSKAAALLGHPWSSHSIADDSDLQLARSMLEGGVHKRDTLNALFTQHGLAGIEAIDALDAIRPAKPAKARRWWQPTPLVTVIIPCYNAANTIETALTSLLQQSWPRLEIIVVDDASSDESISVVKITQARLSGVKTTAGNGQTNSSDGYSGIKDAQTNGFSGYRGLRGAQTKRETIRLLVKKQNEGAYAARNLGLKHARGAFITTHDSDDWSHPQKIEQQVLALLANKQAAASVSHWVRCDNQMQFGRWRAEENWVYRNVSSLMFRRSVFKRLGFWDRVSVNADSEYYERIQNVFGAAAITEVMPGVPLSFGRHDTGSLSQSSSTHLRTQFYGLRRDYMEAARAWHHGGSSLYMAEEPSERPFIAPLSMCRGGNQARRHHALQHIQCSDYFDAAYYLSRYPDLAAAGVDSARHYLDFGGVEGRDPSPVFSSSGYAYIHQLEAGENPLIHALRVGNLFAAPMLASAPNLQADSLRPETHHLSTVNGHQPALPERPWILVCGHSCTAGAFGAERSLLDVLQGLTGEFNILVALPGAQARNYVDSVRALAQHVVFLPYRWWHGAREPDAELIEAFLRLIDAYTIQMVYVNTLTLWEPLLAARAAGVRSIMHVRELVEQDPDLCEVLKASPADISSHVLRLADAYIANSQVVADWLSGDAASTPSLSSGKAGVAITLSDAHAETNENQTGAAVYPNIHIVPNMVSDMNIAPPNWLSKSRDEQACMRVGMLSSNLPKKGLHDFIELARLLEHQCPGQFICTLFGPENDHVAAVNDLPRNLEVCGYYVDPAKALAQLDVVVNMSHFQESFGRSVLEAMAAGRPVVAYDWGALGELLHQGGGVLVPYKDIPAMVQVLTTWQQNPDMYRQQHNDALKVATGYQFPVFRLSLLRAFDVPL